MQSGRFVDQQIRGRFLQRFNQGDLQVSRFREALVRRPLHPHVDERR